MIQRGDGSSGELLILARPRDIGGFAVRRTLPSPKRRLVGPFIFWDHMGPASFGPGEGIDVRPHPHINLATITYLFEGEIIHKDSLGSDVAIRPGAVNWMTAGRGIAHSERTGPETRRAGGRVHAIQSWVALPKASEEVEPSFHHFDARDIPEVEVGGVLLRVLAGRAFGVVSPATPLSPTLYADARMDAGAELALPEEFAERAVYIVDGRIAYEGTPLEEGAMMVVPSGGTPVLRASTPARVMLLGGAPIDGERHIFWNFVSSSPERIERAKLDWKERRFPRIPGDDAEFIPLPE
jgi:redox-sensitive bicupin YhaK (pirin superfamily)